MHYLSKQYLSKQFVILFLANMNERNLFRQKAKTFEFVPPALPGVERVSELKILGVYMSDKLEFTPHTNYITTAAVQSTYALRVLRAHGLTDPKLGEVTRATAVAKLTYACSAWWGYADSAAKARIQAVMNKFKRLGFLSEEVSFVSYLPRTG